MLVYEGRLSTLSLCDLSVEGLIVLCVDKYIEERGSLKKRVCDLSYEASVKSLVRCCIPLKGKGKALSMEESIVLNVLLKW